MKRILMVFCVLFFQCESLTDSDVPYNAQGELVGEVTDTSAIVMTRLTLREHRNPTTQWWTTMWDTSGGERTRITMDWHPDITEGVPGREGFTRLHYSLQPDCSQPLSTAWQKGEAASDFAVHFRITGLVPNSTYYYRVETASAPDTKPTRLGAIGQFRTAPAPDDFEPILFTVITGQKVQNRDIYQDGIPWGYNTYESMAKLKPHFHVSTGDNVYYDSDAPVARTVPMARYHWHRMYSIPSVRGLFSLTSGYWEKDDHDYRYNDSWPAMDLPDWLSHEEGIRVYHEVVPMSDKPYRTFRWGKGLQIWLMEGRDYRSPNTMPDGPDKTIWGSEQKAWLKETLQQSDAMFKVLISPTPMLGPDRDTKFDNHSNVRGFRTEGREFIDWILAKQIQNLFLVCGDRHWQYHTIDETGIQEFSCGPTSDVHAQINQPRLAPERQPHHREKGGFLSVSVLQRDTEPIIRFQFHDVNGRDVYTSTQPLTR